ncbi:MAG: hypothetical protein Tsb0010_14220 [Parvularculaceae bacterium]
MKYFLKTGISREDYENRFKRPKRTLAPVLFEASPQYLYSSPIEARRATLKRMKAIVPDAKFIICLRHPIARAFSHYIYDLHYFAQYGKFFGKGTEKSFLSHPYRRSFAKSKVWKMRYAENLELLLEFFDPENVTFFVLERDATSVQDFFKRLCAFVEEPNDAKIPERAIKPARKCGILPYYQYDESAREFKICTRFGSTVLDGVTPEEADIALSARNAWTASVTESEALELYREYLMEDFEAFLKLAKNCVGGTELPRYSDKIEALAAEEYECSAA